MENPFHGITFYDSRLERSGRYLEPRPCGYLSLRSKFDDGLRKIAMEAGVEFLGGCAVTHLEQAKASSSGSISFSTGQCQSIKWNMYSWISLLGWKATRR